MTSSVPVLVKRHVFGINNRINDNIAFLDSRVLIYVAGRNIVFYNIEEHSQRFVVGSSPSTENWVSDPEIACISLSPNTTHLAIAENGEKPSVTILDTQTLRKKKLLPIPTIIRSKQICSMSFSVNNLYLAIQCGSPDWKLCIFEWEKGLMEHCITTSKNMTPIHQISYCYNNTDPLPTDPNLLAICHENSIQIHQQNNKELNEEDIELVSYETEHKWNCLCWVNDRLICGNNGGDVIVLKDNKFEKQIFSKTDCSIKYIENINNCILAIAADDCTISFLQRLNNEEIIDWKFICDVNISIDNNLTSSSLNTNSNNNIKDSDNKIYKAIPLGMSIDPSGTQLLITTKNNQIYSIDISRIYDNNDKDNNNNNNNNNMSISDYIQKTIRKPLGHFHFEGITGMDICVRKPWIVTCGYDKSICIWNYLTRKLEIVKYFSTIIHCVSFHPSGLHILAGFEDKLKLLNILQDDIEAYKDFHIVRSCSECIFSNGGHIFAAVNGDKIHIYNTYSGELISILRGHNQKIRSLYFNLDDTSLISAGAEGAVYEWSMFNFNRQQEMVNRQCPLNTAIITKDKKIYCTGNTSLLNEIIDGQLEKEIDMNGIEINRLIISHLPQRMIFGSTVNGLIRSIKFPIIDNKNNNNKMYLDYIGHLGKINRIKLSQNDKYLFSCGDYDGCINIFEIRDKEGRDIKEEKNNNNNKEEDKNNNWSAEILVTQTYLYEKKQLILELTNKVDELKLHNEYQLRLREMHYCDTLKEKQDKFNLELKQEKLKYEVLKDEQQDLEMEYEEKIKLKEDQHQKQIQELESFYQSQLMNEIEKYSKLEIELNNKQNKWENDIFNKKDLHQLTVMNLKDKFNNILNIEIENKEKLLNKLKYLENEYKETKKQLLFDYDLEIQELEKKYLIILNEERDNTLRLKGENGVMKKKFNSLQNEIDDQIEETKKMNIQENNFKKQIILLKKEIEKLDSEMLSRDNVIGDKEKKIYKLKKKNQNLEKHKFVLDYKIKSLKKQIEPRQNKILSMKDNVKNLDLKLEGLHKNNGQLKLMINELNQKINILIKQINIKKEKYKKLNLITNKFNYDLTQIIQFIQSPNELKKYFIQKMYNKNKKNNELLLFVDQNYEINKNILNEYKRQTQHLNQCTNQLKKKLNKQSKINTNENYNIMMENVKYMKEIKNLQKELKNLQINQNNIITNDNNNYQNQSETQILQIQIQKQNMQINQLKDDIRNLQNPKVQND